MVCKGGGFTLTAGESPSKILHPSELRMQSVWEKWCLWCVCVCVCACVGGEGGWRDYNHAVQLNVV